MSYKILSFLLNKNPGHSREEYKDDLMFSSSCEEFKDIIHNKIYVTSPNEVLFYVSLTGFRDHLIHYHKLDYKKIQDGVLSRYKNFDVGLNQGEYTDLELAMMLSRKFQDLELSNQNQELLDKIYDFIEGRMI